MLRSIHCTWYGSIWQIKEKHRERYKHDYNHESDIVVCISIIDDYNVIHESVNHNHDWLYDGRII